MTRSRWWTSSWIMSGALARRTLCPRRSRKISGQFLSNMYSVSKLKNGLTVVTEEMPHMTSVSLGLWVGVGGRYEQAEVNGVCHFIEHMLFKGTRRRSARRISQDVEGIGGYL